MGSRCLGVIAYLNGADERPGPGDPDACGRTEALLDNIAANPQQYYLNLHSTPLFPAGAIRGQLQRL